MKGVEENDAPVLRVKTEDLVTVENQAVCGLLWSRHRCFPFPMNLKKSDLLYQSEREIQSCWVSERRPLGDSLQDYPHAALHGA